MNGFYVLAGVALLVIGLLIVSLRLAKKDAVSRDDLKEARKAAMLAEKARLAHEKEDAENLDL